MAIPGAPGTHDPTAGANDDDRRGHRAAVVVANGTVSTTGACGALPAGAFGGALDGAGASASAGPPWTAGPATCVALTPGHLGAAGHSRRGHGHGYILQPSPASAPGRYGYRLPQVPASVPGRVVIRAERDPGMPTDPRRWVPRLDGDLGFVVGQNAAWLRTETVGALLRELTNLAAQPAASAPAGAAGPTPRLRAAAACAALILLAMFAGCFLWVSHRRHAHPGSTGGGSENAAPLAIMGLVLLLFCLVPSATWLVRSRTLKGAAGLAGKRSAFCVAWTARNPGYTLTYHQLQTGTPYFELSRAVEAP